MNETVAWLLTTAAFWFLSNLVSNAIEASVQNYWTRVVVMAAAGTAIGALASAVGYGFFLLALLLFMQLWFVRRKLRSAMGGNRSVAAKYAFPALLLVVFATAGSYLFSIEACDAVDDGCKRIFFERLYTPPHLRPPTG